MIGLCRGLGVEVGLEGGERKVSRRGQKVGEYCGGKDLKECRDYFGKALPAACSTCPN